MMATTITTQPGHENLIALMGGTQVLNGRSIPEEMECEWRNRHTDRAEKLCGSGTRVTCEIGLRVSRGERLPNCAEGTAPNRGTAGQAASEIVFDERNKIRVLKYLQLIPHRGNIYEATPLRPFKPKIFGKTFHKNDIPFALSPWQCSGEENGFSGTANSLARPLQAITGSRLAALSRWVRCARTRRSPLSGSPAANTRLISRANTIPPRRSFSRPMTRRTRKLCAKRRVGARPAQNDLY